MRVWVILSHAVVLGACSTFVGADTVEEGSSTEPGTTAENTEGGEPTNPAEDATTDPTTDPSTSASTSGDTSGGGNSTSTGMVPMDRCGDGERQDPEVCDDGNGDELDGCTSACVVGPLGVAFGAESETNLVGGGSSTGITNAVERCPPDEVLVGLRGGISMEGWLGVIGGRCQRVGLSNADPPALITEGPPTNLPGYGQFQTRPWQTECPDDQVIVAVRGGAGDVMDGLQIRCADVQTLGDPGAYTLDPTAGAWEPLQGGSDGSSFGPLVCPEGTVATGMQTETNSYVVRLRLLCREISLSYP